VPHETGFFCVYFFRSKTICVSALVADERLDTVDMHGFVPVEIGTKTVPLSTDIAFEAKIVLSITVIPANFSLRAC
jgi:hypothetical protein